MWLKIGLLLLCSPAHGMTIQGSLTTTGPNVTFNGSTTTFTPTQAIISPPITAKSSATIIVPNGQGILLNDTTHGNSWFITGTNGGALGGLNISYTTSTTHLFLSAANTIVGINTNNPIIPYNSPGLVVAGDDAIFLATATVATGNNTSYLGSPSTNGGMYVESISGRPLHLGVVANSGSAETDTNVTILLNGNVGIGTTNPTSALTVQGVIQTTGTFSFPSSGAGANIYSQNGQGHFLCYDYNSSNYVKCFVDGTPLILNGNSGGNVGINTANPITNLDIRNTTNGIGEVYIATSTASNSPYLNSGVESSGGNILTGSSAGDGIIVTGKGNLDLSGPGQSVQFQLQSGGVKMPNGTTGAMLCLTAGGLIGHCTAAASCTGTCTCTCAAN